MVEISPAINEASPILLTNVGLVTDINEMNLLLSGRVGAN